MFRGGQLRFRTNISIESDEKTRWEVARSEAFQGLVERRLHQRGRSDVKQSRRSPCKQPQLHIASTSSIVSTTVPLCALMLTPTVLQCKFYGYYKVDQHRFFLFELCEGGELFNMLHERGCFSEAAVRNFAK